MRKVNSRNTTTSGGTGCRLQRGEVLVLISTKPSSPTMVRSSDAILTQLSVTAADKDNGSVSFSLNGTGAWTVGTN